MIEFLSLIILIVLAFICGNVAENKGYDGLVFGFLSLFAWLIVMIIVLILPDRNNRRY